MKTSRCKELAARREQAVKELKKGFLILSKGMAKLGFDFLPSEDCPRKTGDTVTVVRGHGKALVTESYDPMGRMIRIESCGHVAGKRAFQRLLIQGLLKADIPDQGKGGSVIGEIHELQRTAGKGGGGHAAE